MAKHGQSLPKARAVRRPAKPPVDLKQKIAGLKRELAQALERQAATSEELTATSDALNATSEVLKVISRSTFDLQPVFDAIAENAVRLCQAERAFIFRFDGERLRAVAYYNVGRGLKEFVDRNPIAPGRHSISARAALERRTIHVHDVQADPEYAYAARDVDLIRTMLVVPMLKGDDLVGTITIYRLVVKPFTDEQVALVETFANQAVIAIENTRLLTAQREALAQQTATAEVLQVINSSPGELAPVFDAMLEKALELCGAAFGILWTYDGTRSHAAAMRGVPPALTDLLTQAPHPVGPDRAVGRLLRGEAVVHVPDAMEDKAYRSGDPLRRAMVDLGGMRTLLGVPLRKENAFFGAFTIYRQEVRPFSDKEVTLLENFAAQAVIAIENARLITETREALEQQTATAEVLQVINSSPGNLDPVFTAMLEKALYLCGADFGKLLIYEGEGRFHSAAERGVPAPYAAFLAGKQLTYGPGTGPYRVLKGADLVHEADLMDTEAYRVGEPLRRAFVDLGGARTALHLALRKDGALLGIVEIYRQEVRPFTDKQIALLQNFAAQAVIAMENARLITETREALEQQTATAEVLRVISSSPGELQAVFDAILANATRICEAQFAMLSRWEGDTSYTDAMRDVPPRYANYLRNRPRRLGPQTAAAKARTTKQAVQHVDIRQNKPYLDQEADAVAIVELGGARTLLAVPMLKDDEPVGTITIYREEVRPFTDKQIGLVTSFAAQAVIAMENARLLGEIRHRNDELAEALEFQTATGEVLRIVASSPDNLQSVFDAMLEKATELCEAKFGNLFLYDGEAFTVVADRNLPPAYAQAARAESRRPGPNTALRHLIESKAPVHIRDMFGDAAYAARDPLRVAAIELGGVRSLVAVPLLKKGELIGAFSIYRDEPGGFAENQIALVTTFADQAVIAIENSRLFGELRQRTADLARSVDELTATGDVLKIISRSSVDLETVLDTLVETVARLCRADQGFMFRLREDMYQPIASYGLSQAAEEFVVAHPFAPGRGSLNGRVALERRAVHIPDVLQDREYLHREAQKVLGYRTMLGVPLLRGDELIGIFTINRTRVEPFAEKEIELASTFADQAVIAIENARLFEELRDRQAELRVTFDNMGDGVAMFDGQQRLAAWNSNFQQILDMPDALLARRLTYADYLRILAERGEFGTEDIEAELSRRLQDTERELRLERTRPDGRVIEVRRNPVPGGGFVLIYADITERKRAEAAIRAARDAAEAALSELQTAQASLVHAQKMAALGQLTAGIAHEIKNPLNFVNNFAGLSVELLDELKQASAQAMGALDANKRAEIVETIQMLTSNLEKIAEHGRRADGIVKSMLQHSRGGSGDWQASDLNALVEEALNLAYHGARAQDQSFNITMERALDPNLAPIEVVPQDVMRVFLNLIGNGFYATHKRSREGDGAFRPVLKVTTRELGDTVEVGVRDNGVGIPPEHREKLFQPFFTTKPTGEGTGLGLSISYEIVTQQHGGSITVASELGEFTEFIVRLPRRQRPAGRVA